MRDLATIQRRFYELVTAGEGAIEPGLLGTSRRLDVYAEMYVARLHDVLVADYPKLRSVLGEEAFRDLTAKYVRARPPTSYTVRNAGVALPHYLAARDDLPAWFDDLASLERARVEVFDGPDCRTWSCGDLAALPVEQFPALTLRLVPASTIVDLRWTVDDLWSAIEDEHTRTEPEPCARRALVWRRNLRVLHRTVDHDEYRLLPLLATGATIAELSEVIADDTEPVRRVVALLTRWLDAQAIEAARG